MMMKSFTSRTIFSGQVAAFALASALCVSAGAQQPASGSSDAANQPAPASQGTPSTLQNSQTPGREGFWGRVNPFARKKWVNKRIDPIKGQLNELDEVNAKNASDIKDVDARAQAGISKAQTAAEQANNTATAANQQAMHAGQIAGQASGQVDHLNGTVNGLDQYSEVNAVRIEFRGSQPVLSAAAKEQLDDLATKLAAEKGYLVEMEAHAPGAGGVGIQSSSRMADAVKRYLVTQHEIPVYRIHSVALGNVPAGAPTDDGVKPKPERKSYVELRLMENSLAAKDGQTPRLSSSTTGAAQQ